MIKKIRQKVNVDIHLKELITGTVITFIFKVFGMGLGYVLIFLISKKNGAEGVGLYSLFNQVLLVLSMILGLGMNISVLRFVGQFNNEKDRPKMHILYSYIIRLMVPITVLAGTLLFCGADYIVDFFDKSKEYASGIRLVGFVLPFFAINQVCMEFIRGLKKLQISELVRSVINPAIMIFGILILWKNSITIIDILYLFVIGSIINSVISSGTIWLQLKKTPKNNFIEFSKRELLSTSSPMMITSIASALMTALPFFFLGFYTSQHDVGIFSVAFRVAQIISLILLIINTIAAPKFAELFWADKKQELQKLITQSSKIMFWVALVISIIVIIGSEKILKLFGDSFSEGRWTLIILVIGQFINAATGSVGILMNMIGDQKYIRNSSIIALLFFVLISLILIPKLGVIAVPIALTISSSLWKFYCAYFIVKKYKIKTYYFFSD